MTLLGMVTEIKLLQSEKAPYPILVTLSGMVIEVKLFIPAHRCAGIYRTLSLNINEVIFDKENKGKRPADDSEDEDDDHQAKKRKMNAKN